ncbi:MAG: hypothetical protein C4293_11905 [Nitrospiraceae bacterium]
MRVLWTEKEQLPYREGTETNKQRGLVVAISNTEIAILKYVQSTTGVGKITNKRITSENHTPSYTYQLSNRQALSLLKQIAPFLKSHKALRTALVLREYLRLTPRNGRYTKDQLEERDLFIKKFFAIRARAEVELRGEMNRIS